MRILLVIALLAACGPTAPARSLTGSVTATRGPSPVVTGTPCEVTITPDARGGYPCRVTITCGPSTLSGGKRLGGYCNCSVENGQWTRAWDTMLPGEDGDPWVLVDIGAREAIVRTDSEVRIALQ